MDEYDSRKTGRGTGKIRWYQRDPIDVLRVRIPLFILPFIMADAALALAYTANFLAGSPFEASNHFFNLGGEANLPSWYSSMQWFCVAILLGIFAALNLRAENRHSWILPALPIVFLAMSADEVALIHEILDTLSDKILPGASREDAIFQATGIWMIVIGVPFVGGMAALAISVRGYFADAPGVLVKLVGGMAVMLAGGLGIETLSNLVDPDSAYGVLQILAEETCEMAGSTIVLWGSCELLAKHGLAVQFTGAKDR